MTEYGLQIKNNISKTIIKDKSVLALKIFSGGILTGGVYNNSVYHLNYKSINNTMNVDVVWNSDQYVSPYAQIVERGTINISNRFIIDTSPLLLTNALSVGVGSEIPKLANTHGIYILDNKGTEILNSENKMLRLVAQFANVVTDPILTLAQGTGIRQGWMWDSIVDISDLDWRSGARWISISPLRSKVFFPFTNGYLFITTIFYMDSDTLYIGNYYYADTTDATFLLTAESYIINLMLFSEGN